MSTATQKHRKSELPPVKNESVTVEELAKRTGKPAAESKDDKPKGGVKPAR